MIEIPLTRGYVAIVDDGDGHLAQRKWCVSLKANGTAYATGRNANGERTLLHREVLGLRPGDPSVDHKNGDGLDCRRANLERSTFQANGRNRGAANRDNTSSRMLGVSYHRLTGKWQAYIRVAGRLKYLGLHSTPSLAQTARLAGEKAVWGVTPRRAALHGAV